ncbi:MAG: 50S ribosomal protein L9 [Bacteroidales bacterium]|nr:50S ribosomal protein L9 [Bacteroidales bacterium]
MEVILKDDVRKLGHKNDIVTVKDGYANNFLFPRGLAVIATPSAKKQLAETMKQRAHKEAKLVADAQALAEKLNAVSVTIPTKVSQLGKIYGSVNNIQVAEALAKEGYEIDRRKIELKDAEKISEIGTYSAIIDLYRGVEATVKVVVVDEEGKVTEVVKEVVEKAPKKEKKAKAEKTEEAATEATAEEAKEERAAE